MQIPNTGIHDSPGQRLPKPEEGIAATGIIIGVEEYGGAIFYLDTQALEAMTQIAIIKGSCDSFLFIPLL